MIFEEFQHLARLSVVGVLDPDEVAQFEAGRCEFGPKAERFIQECRKLNAVFALSLRPCEPDPRTKVRLMARIRASSRTKVQEPPEGMEFAPEENASQGDRVRRSNPLACG